MLLNTLFFYQTERDGADYIPNALRTAPGHLKDENAELYLTPPLDANDLINNVPPAKPLSPANLPNIDASGGWWDAGDYEKYVETVSYTVALMEIGVRDFPNQMGPGARSTHPRLRTQSLTPAIAAAEPRQSADFSSEARFGLAWLLKMWRDGSQPLAYQVDNTQDWNYYGEGDPTFRRRQLWRDLQHALLPDYRVRHLDPSTGRRQLPATRRSQTLRSAHHFLHLQSSGVCSAAGKSLISPNLAGRLAADFAVCYQLNRQQDPALANQCLQDAEEVFARADTHYTDPAPAVGSGSCPTCLLTIAPFDGYPETVWDDDMELGATELYLALSSGLSSGLEEPGFRTAHHRSECLFETSCAVRRQLHQ